MTIMQLVRPRTCTIQPLSLQLASNTSGGSVASSHSEDAVHGPALVQNGGHGCSDTESRRKTIHGP
ncbi:hypothetical protein X797_010204 [Metarhizium robertsii]|uniref:Uncharacterized protein n=1 Tax=Metarhizium robertsii TaxID=568076 RepID=A0A014QUB1_9HYPO|nr:hypothetical protein X797_010204 [Metarhizium robertsii]